MCFYNFIVVYSIIAAVVKSFFSKNYKQSHVCLGFVFLHKKLTNNYSFDEKSFFDNQHL